MAEAADEGGEPRRRVHVENGVHFINLSNGLEAAPFLSRLGISFGVIRAQSSQCESSKPEKLLDAISDDFLLALAQGNTAYVYDFGSRDPQWGVPRALWYGMEFVRWVLELEWLGEPTRPPSLRGKDGGEQFRSRLRAMREDTKKRIKYFRQFLPQEGLPHGVSIACMYSSTSMDGQKEYYSRLAEEWLSPAARSRRALQLQGTLLEIWSHEDFLAECQKFGLTLYTAPDPKEWSRRQMERAERRKRVHGSATGGEAVDAA